MVTLGSEISLLGLNSKPAMKFGWLFPKEDFYSLNYREKQSSWFLKWEHGVILRLEIVELYANESKFHGIKENTDLFENEGLKYPKCKPD